MPNVRSPAGARVYIQSAISGIQAVSAITKASPPVLTYVGADTWSNGNYVALSSMVGMTELEDALCRVANVSTGANTLELEDQNSTGYGTHVSGNAQLVTMATEIVCASGFTMSGGEQEFAEYRFLWDRIKRKFPTTKGSTQITIPAVWDPQDAGSAAVLAAADLSQKTGFKIVFPDGLEMLFFGYIGNSGLPRADNPDAVMQTDISVTIASRIRYAFP